MSPRHNRRRRVDAAVDDLSARAGVQRTEHWPDGNWIVRNVPGKAAVKIYRCPGCDHEIYPGTAHIVAWPDDSGSDVGLSEGPSGRSSERRHWHTACWRARDRRHY